MADADYEAAEPRYEEDERRGYDSRDRSRSPRGDAGESGVRARSASPNGRDRYESRDGPADNRSDEANTNPGSNLFVTGIAPRLSEQEVSEMFGKYGEVEKCNIMRDPHTGDSRGFGFVKMVTSDGADAARDALSGQNIEGRTLSVEKARRGRPRTPTPGKYYGPPKRDGPGGGFRGGRGGGGGRRFDSYDDRRGGDRGYGRRDDYGGGGYRGGRDRGYGDRREDRYGGGDAYYGSGGGGGSGYGSGGSRGYGGGGRDREYDGGRERVDRYASGPPRDDRRSYGGEERRGYSGGGGGGGSGGGYPREDRGGSGYGDAPPRDREPYQGSRG